MAHKFIVHTDKGKLHSLERPVQIIFTLTPVECKRRTVYYDPVVWRILNFESDVDKRLEFEWDMRLAFAPYETKHTDGKLECSVEGTCYSISPGQSRTGIKPPGDRNPLWKAAEPLDKRGSYGQECLSVLNNTGTSQKLVLCVRDTQSLRFNKVAAYHPIENGERIVAPSSFILQAYAVDSSQNYKWRILTAQDLMCSLLEISSDILPATSIWRLSQNRGGEIRLENNDEPRLDIPTRNLATFLAGMNNRMNTMNNRIDTMTKSFTETQSRLLVIETSVSSVQKELASDRQTVAEIHRMVNGMKSPAKSTTQATQAPTPSPTPTVAAELVVDPRIALLEAKTVQLAESLDKTGRFLLAMRDFVKDARPQLAELTATVPAVSGKLDESVVRMQQDISALKIETESRLTGLGDKIAKVEAKVDSGGDDVLFPPITSEARAGLQSPTTPLDPILDFSLDL